MRSFLWFVGKRIDNVRNNAGYQFFAGIRTLGFGSDNKFWQYPVSMEIHLLSSDKIFAFEQTKQDDSAGCFGWFDEHYLRHNC
ncbi:hypothetical protein SRA_03151 [Streptococcus ratti FA-1 = DSM 20564]|uniref:Uncharacterized protein n=1 Tax=Streptococcus ratti FA-1 = DSM 20564 TaxID=699248 RepID=A0ABP2QWQ8_STRRT|nr:hypothetical protein SRA_03151 [Streptococcus ratti FA-1 = DSM 20564]